MSCNRLYVKLKQIESLIPSHHKKADSDSIRVYEENRSYEKSTRKSVNGFIDYRDWIDKAL